MKPKYTTEAMRETLLNQQAQQMIGCNWSDLKMNGLSDGTEFGGWRKMKERVENSVEQIIDLFTAQQQALLDEVEKQLPEKWSMEGGISGSDGSIMWSKAIGHNEVIDQVTETLASIRKELK